MTATGQAVAVLRRELAIERAGREVVTTALPLTAAFVVLGGLAFGPVPRDLANTAGGTVWLAVLVATVPVARALLSAELTEDAWDVVRGLTAPGSLYAGKLLAVWAALGSVWALASGLVVVLFDVWPPPVAALGAGVLGTLALASVTTTVGVLVASGARRRGLLPALVLPAGLPALLSGAQLSTPGVPALPWVVLLASYAAVLVTASWTVFPALLEE
jgi:heme exporter protein B